MKKRFLYLLLFLSAFIGTRTVMAQVEVALVPKLGYGFSTYRLNYPSIQHRMRSAPTAGLLFQLRASEIFLFETGLQVSSRGSIQTGLDTIPRIELITTYADFPFLIGVQPSEQFFEIKGGIQFSNIINGYLRSEGSSTQNTELYNTWDVAALMEVTYQFDFGLNLGLRMVNGITNMRREEVIFPNNAFVDEFRSFSIQLLAGYKLPLRFR